MRRRDVPIVAWIPPPRRPDPPPTTEYAPQHTIAQHPMSFTRRAKMHVALSRFGRGKKDPGFFASL
jgi:hypothetical protein